MGKRKKWNSEKILGISAMSISFFTLLIFLYQTNLIRNQNYISILPYLAISTSDSSVNNNYQITLDNFGVGPAIIEKVNIQYLGDNYDINDYDNSIFKFLSSKYQGLDSIKHISYSTIGAGLAIPATTSYNIIEIKNDSLDYNVFKQGLNTLLDNGISIQVYYKSIQNEHWMISNMSEGPVKLD